jgi:hypothetical protein
LVGTAIARSQKAPLPSEIVSAKKVFILKGVGSVAFTVTGGFDMAFDAFYSEMKPWGRYVIVDKPEDADLIMRVSYTAAGSSGSLNLQLTLVVLSPSHAELWSTSVAPGVAFRRKNQEKEMIKAGQTLATNLRRRF